VCCVASAVFTFRLPALRPEGRQLIIAQEVAGGDPATEMTAPSLAIDTD
jgi:hypothetical protein